jgi:hypothetical protein
VVRSLSVKWEWLCLCLKIKGRKHFSLLHQLHLNPRSFQSTSRASVSSPPWFSWLAEWLLSHLAVKRGWISESWDMLGVLKNCRSRRMSEEGPLWGSQSEGLAQHQPWPVSSLRLSAAPPPPSLSEWVFWVASLTIAPTRWIMTVVKSTYISPVYNPWKVG